MGLLSYASGTSQEPLLGITIGDQFDQTAERFPDQEAVIVRHQNIRLSYQELKQEVDTCARAFIHLGLEKGERIGIWSPNCYEWLLTQLATSKIGAILVNINPSYRVHELEYALKQSGCSMLVLADQFKGSDYTGMIHELVPELLDHTKGDFTSERLPALRQAISLSQENRAGLLPWKHFLEGGAQVKESMLRSLQASLSFDEAINIQYTSGTTGYPKGATLSHHNILNNGHLVTKMMNFSEKDRLVIPVPLYHCFGMVMGNLGCISHGATIIYPSEGFEPRAVLEAVQEEKATALYGVPTMFIAELEHPDFAQFDLSSLRTGVMAGSICPVEVMIKVNSLMHMEEVEIAYGMTETSPVSTQTRADAPLNKRVSTVGQVMPHTEVKIIDPDTGQVLPRGVPGEVCTRGYCVMLGYWDNEEQTREAIDAARWMHTGDIGFMDEEGYITIVGRIKDMIIRGGENVYPREIEEFLYQHPAIQEVQVVGVPDPKFGEEICAWVQVREGNTLTIEEVKSFCQDKISHYKIPRYVRFVEGFPMTVTGKVRKVEMRRISTEELNLTSND